MVKGEARGPTIVEDDYTFGYLPTVMAVRVGGSTIRPVEVFDVGQGPSVVVGV